MVVRPQALRPRPCSSAGPLCWPPPGCSRLAAGSATVGQIRPDQTQQLDGERHLFLAVSGTVLAASGVALIALALTTQTTAQQSASTESAERASVAFPAEPAAARQRPAVEEDSFGPPTTLLSVPEAVDNSLPLSSSEPVTIDIPAIEVHSEVQYLGLTAQHTLEVPAPGPYYNQAAWYKHSATPGAIGPAIMLGHVDSAADGPSVFFDLATLRPGDEVLVTRRDGMVAVFAVESVGRYPKDDFPTELVYGTTDHAALRLITCGGTFDSSSRHYRDNVVVFANLVDSYQAPRGS